eukprot:CAMPEP_0197026890 /NCGR_PEP_ID=MMETSP1384-20130603/6896_1 /TAXON_ID=29189 /ORGANISM="Ammonia sp." /LENGTH=458 /DNA_ID=CAMNT_0042455649 /DNA_START=35 /DNA_END=1411 /DNA_ORIENTATION=+
MCKSDWNYKLAYPTVKMVMVADWRLGLLRYTCLLAILLYIVVYALWYERGYLDLQSPDGTVTATLQRPASANVKAEDFAYCNASAQSQSYSDPLLCEVWPEDMVLFPTATQEHMMITTRVSEQFMTFNPQCTYQTFGAGGTTCNGSVSYVVSSTPHRYLAGVENYTVMITHAMLDLKHYELTGHEKYCLTGEQMDGKLVDFDGNELMHFPPNQSLILTVQDLLDAAETDLSDLSDAESHGGSIKTDETMRHAGIMLMVIINYDNTYSTHNRNPKYTMQVVRIKQAEYKVTESIQWNQTYRMIRDRHGIYVTFVQGGRIGKFNFQTALIALVASLGLLGVSTLLVDSLMLYCCKHKADYYSDKYDYTQAYANDPRFKVSLNLHKKKHGKEKEKEMTESLVVPGMEEEYDGGAGSNTPNYSVNDDPNMPPSRSGGYNGGNMYNVYSNEQVYNRNTNRFNM